MAAGLRLVTLEPGQVWWMDPARTVGREQSGRRPGVVVSGEDYLDAVTTLAWVVPVTSRDRGWPNHVPLSGPTGLGVRSLAMTEQLTTVSRERLVEHAGDVDPACLESIRVWLHDSLS